MVEVSPSWFLQASPHKSSFCKGECGCGSKKLKVPRLGLWWETQRTPPVLPPASSRSSCPFRSHWQASARSSPSVSDTRHPRHLPCFCPSAMSVAQVLAKFPTKNRCCVRSEESHSPCLPLAAPMEDFMVASFGWHDTQSWLPPCLSTWLPLPGNCRFLHKSTQLFSNHRIAYECCVTL